MTRRQFGLASGTALMAGGCSFGQSAPIPPAHHPAGPPAGPMPHCLADHLLKIGYPLDEYKRDSAAYQLFFERLQRAEKLVWPQGGTRWDQAKASQQKKDRFVNAVKAMRQETSAINPAFTTYGYLVWVHQTRGVLPGMEPVHYARTSDRSDGTFDLLPGAYRFLPWHRRLLLHFESEVRRIDGSSGDPLALPYWRWTDGFPFWLDAIVPIARTLGQLTPSKPNATDVANVQSAAERHQTDTSLSKYAWYTRALEGYEENVAAHLTMHAWCGTTMNEVMTSPNDPVFWLLHAEVDRLWAIWQQSHPPTGPNNSPDPNHNPLLHGAGAFLDPWKENYQAVMKFSDLGYTYESMVP